MSNKLDKLKRYPLGDSFPGVFLTEREVFIAIELYYGKPLTKIAKKFNCGKRTVNFYIESMKKTLSCDSIENLIQCIKNSELIQKMENKHGK